MKKLILDYSLYNLITIQHIFGAGSNRAYKVYKAIKETNNLSSKFTDILKNILFNDEIRIKLLTADYSYAEDIILKCEEQDISILSIEDDEYPKRLKNIQIPPIVLYYKGSFPDFDKLPSITIVGPRTPTQYGQKAAFSLGYRLSKAGMVVVSGGALGCDTAAHNGVYSASGVTVMVLGCGIGADYLSENKTIREKALEKGCIISEYPPKTKPTKYSFPLRNRIVSGLTLGTVVIEATEKSGSLITAKCALEQGRDVFVIPGNPSVKSYKGSNQLLREGAKPLLDASDIFSEYLAQYAEYLDIEKAFSNDNKVETQKNIKKYEKNLKETLSNEGKIVYNYLDKQVFSIDDLSGTELSSDLILSALTELELENLIEPLPGGTYKLK